MSAHDRGGHKPKVVLVTGASRFLSGFLVCKLAQNPDIDRVIALDMRSPSKDMLRRMGRAEFVRADIRNPLISKVISENEVDTVVHAATVSRSQGNRAAIKDQNVLGAMQLFAACQKAQSVRKVVVRSSSAVYGCSARDPIKFTEQMSARIPPRGGFALDTLEVEAFARGMGRRRPDVAVSTLRFAPLIGPRLNSAVSQYFTLPVVPAIFGRDARMQLLHEEDGLAALEHATIAGPAGTFNIAGDGIVMMSQAIRRAGRLEAPMPFFVFKSAGRSLMGPIMRGFSKEQIDYFLYGCGLDTTRMRTELGFEPRWTTVQAFDDFVKGAALRPVIDPAWIDSAQNKLLEFVGTPVRTPLMSEVAQ